MQLRNNRRLLIVFACLIVLVAVIALIASSGHKKSSQPQGTYVDPLSHETVSNPPGKAPDTYGTNPARPLYLGFDKLLDHGITFDQLNNLKLAFFNYSQTQKPHIKQVSIDVDHITTSYQQTPTSSIFAILFKGAFDQTTYFNAKAQYTGITDIRLILTDTNGKQIYDSGVINGSTSGE